MVYLLFFFLSLFQRYIKNESSHEAKLQPLWIHNNVRLQILIITPQLDQCFSFGVGESYLSKL